MAGNHQIHRRVQPRGDFHNQAAETGPAVVLTSVGKTALVKKDRYRLDSLLLEPGDKEVDRIRLIKEGQPCEFAAGDDQWGVPSRVKPMNATLIPWKSRTA